MKYLPVLLLFLAVLEPAFSFDAYVARYLIEKETPLAVGNVLHVSNKTEQIDWQKKIGSPGDNPALISLPEVRFYLESAGVESAVLIGKRPVFIPRTIQNTREQQFYVHLLDFLQNIFPEQDERLDIELIGEIPNLFGEDSGKGSFSVEEKNLSSMRMKWVDPRGEAFTFNVYYSRKVPVYVSKRFISAGTKIKKEYLYVKLIEREKYQKGELLSGISGSPVYAISNIPAGVPFLNQYISFNEIVRKGESVSIIIERGGFHMKFEGTTLETAEIGSPVRVKPYRGSKEISGILTGSDEVRVD